MCRKKGSPIETLPTTAPSLPLPETEALRLAAIVECSQDAIIGKDLDGRITAWNDAAATLFGYSAAEVLGRPVEMLIPPECAHEEARIQAQLALGLRVPTFDTVRLARDGRRVDVSLTIFPIRDATGAMVGAAKIARDVGATRRAAAALRQSEARLRFILESAQIGDWEMDLASGVTRRSLQHDRCFGYDTLQADWGVDIFLSHVHPHDRPAAAACVARALRDEQDWRLECRVVWPDESVHWIRVCGSMKCQGGVPVGILGIITDITAQKHVDELHRVSSAYARSLIEASLDPLVTISAEGKITDVNEALVEATGVGREAMIGHDFSDHFTAPEEARSGYRQAFSAGLVRNYPLAIRHASGRVMDVLFNAAVYRDDSGVVRGVVAAARDITERRRLDLVLQASTIELQAAKLAAETANLAKSDFLSSMSHELRSPLNAILGFAQLMDTGTPTPTPSQKESIGQILRAGWYLLELINEILDLALIESGKTSLSTEPVCLAEVLDDCRAMIEPQAHKSGIALDFQPTDESWHVLADRLRVKQVFINLLSNAIKYNRVGGRVDVSCGPAGPGRIRIGFRDLGRGLDAGEQAQLFQPFNRLGRESGAEEGTGIGLVVCKRLVELMDGRIGVESTVGVGSLFWVELATAAAPPTAAQLQAAAAETALGPARGDRRTLLCVEDNPANLRLVERILERRLDIRLVSARDALRGIDLARLVCPAVILMDINLPGMNGFTALRMLAQDARTAHIPVIALSANAMPHDIQKGTRAGFFRYLTKPIKVDEFLGALDEALALGGDEPRPATEEQDA